MTCLWCSSVVSCWKSKNVGADMTEHLTHFLQVLVHGRAKWPWWTWGLYCFVSCNLYPEQLEWSTMQLHNKRDLWEIGFIWAGHAFTCIISWSQSYCDLRRYNFWLSFLCFSLFHHINGCVQWHNKPLMCCSSVLMCCMSLSLICCSEVLRLKLLILLWWY